MAKMNEALLQDVPVNSSAPAPPDQIVVPDTPDNLIAFSDPRTPHDELKPTLHRVSFLLNCLAGGSLAFLVANELHLKMLHFYIPTAVFFTCYMVYLYEALCCCNGFSRTCMLLLNVDRYGAAIEPLIQNLRYARPVVTMHVECFHYKMESPKPGVAARSDKTVTWRQSKEIRYDDWADRTPTLLSTQQNKHPFGLVRLYSQKQLVFADHCTLEAFEAQKNDFQNSNRWRDDQMSFSVAYTIGGFQPQLCCVLNANMPIPCLIRSPMWFVFATVFLLSWPFRMYMNRFLLGEELLVSKEIRCNPPTTTSARPSA
eukprot:c26012_g1_i1.p1 GENE.c26012_g1_i1~~c26012_g1_i1.p1  ORF type:complete len:325 (-),score=45.85 c26012_g1_i1:224-1165(-)